MIQEENEMDYVHTAIAEVLFKLLRDNSKQAMITYGELSDQIDNLVSPRNTASYLGDLSVWAHEAGAPMISALVINQKDLMPGKGFFKLYAELTGKKVKNENEVFKTELIKVREYDKWEKFALSLGIVDVF